MSVGCRRCAAVIGCLFLSGSLLFAGWSSLSSGTSQTLNSVQFPVDANVGYAVGTGGTILKTTDAGGNWVPLTSGTSKTLYSVSFVDSLSGFAVGESGAALKTTDGGNTWTPMNVGTTGNLLDVQLVEGSGTAYVIYDTRSANGVRKTTDWGASWQATAAVPGMAPQVRCLCFASELVGYVAGENGCLAKTLDGGGTYQLLGTGISPGYRALAFRPLEPAVGFIAGSGGIVYRTTDAGATWATTNPPSALSYVALSFPPSTNGVFAAGPGGMIARYAQGSGWKVQATGVTSEINGLSFPVDGVVGYAVGASGVILKTTDGGIGLEEGRGPTPVRTGIRVVSNPCRHGIAFNSGTDAAVAVYDASGSVVMSRAATRGLSFLPLRKAGVYIVKAGAETARAVVTD